ncbi:5,10-methylenetetrahydrofolate reductase [Saccharopolyspora erythraea NRRL 2338]|uniref:Methylenetetrahydrofolate reductase n=3 Tax=Saccharopolyspora erythraea TaxID=1836 RepID=A4FL79_SACEN|nr:5,10-methylenetetrahydrofolate reductase [Saccharopolyspora erythraea D]QRK88510.1 methylenetetrahydrofolate reductase [Saccharopolyspora erythraea]CAM04804.1 5,10-methylenetetrahydrofolate reductase [Saccharopolyspora erythraea NRRL 2338]
MEMSETTRTLQRHLENARFEVLPLRGVVEQVGNLPEGTTVTVTSSPKKGVEATLDVAARVRGLGHHVVPHLAARLLTGPAHLAAVLDRIEGLGMTEVFAVAGDSAEPAGPYPDALSLLRAMEELGRRPSRVGITGYPERHAFIPDATTISAMSEKAAHADYIVSQICYDPHALASWVKDVRARGVVLPIHIGVPGVVDVHRLLRISLKIGLGESMRFLRKQHGVVTKLLTRYTPEELFDELSPHLADPAYGIAGWHFFTFNEVDRTDRWRQDLLARIGEVPA